MTKAITGLPFIRFQKLNNPVLKTWHPLALGVAVATLHSCSGNELKKFIVVLTEFLSFIQCSRIQCSSSTPYFLTMILKQAVT
jgi:hypothetical protein